MGRVVTDSLRLTYRSLRRLSGFDNWEDFGRTSDDDNPAVVDKLLTELGNPRIFMRWQAAIIVNSFPFQIFPAEIDSVDATIGSVVLGGERILSFNEIIRFRASSSAPLRFPGATEFSVISTSPFLALAEEPAGDIVSINPGFELEDDTLYVVSQGVRRTAVGSVTINYNVTYREAEYFPLILPDGVQYGTIVATLGTAAEILDVQPPRLDRPDQWVEIYRVVSTVIVDGDGRWEKPPDWPEDNTYPGIGTADLPDPDASLDIERVHEYGYISWMGQTTRETYHHTNEKPYFGSATYRPQYVWRQTDAASIPLSHRRGFLRHADLPKLKQGAATRWPGLE